MRHAITLLDTRKYQFLMNRFKYIHTYNIGNPALRDYVIRTGVIL